MSKKNKKPKKSKKKQCKGCVSTTSEIASKFISFGPPKAEITVMQYLSEKLEIALGAYTPEREKQITRNYTCLVSIINNDLKELSAEIKRLKQLYKDTPKDKDYRRKRIMYFINLNYKARDEVLDYLDKGLSDDLIKYQDRDIINQLDEVKSELPFALRFRYDYTINRNYYRYDYDFSTDIKVRFLPGGDMLETLSRIKEYVELNHNSPSDFEAEIHRIVESNKLMTMMYQRIKNDFYLHKRNEVFNVLDQLFTEQKYLAFITLAVVQLEGMFYDLCLIKFGDQKNMGTLVEKVEKALRSNPSLYQILYPYFAFDIPDLRNEIAHTGLLHGQNLKTVAYGLVLDMNCILRYVEKESRDKFITFWIISEDLDKVENQDDHEALANQLLASLYMCVPLAGDYFIDVLKFPEKYMAEITFYMPEEKDENKLYLPDIVKYISAGVKSKLFWTVVLKNIKEVIGEKTESSSGFIKFISNLRNSFIPILVDPAKEVCIAVSKELKRFGL